MKDTRKLLISASLLARAYAFAKAGYANRAGRLLVRASEDGILDDVMDGVAQSVETLENGPSSIDDEEDEMMPEEAGTDCGEDSDMESVQVPESVARLAARTAL